MNQLVERYRRGELSDTERKRLEEMSLMDPVMATAAQHARTRRRSQLARVDTTAALLVGMVGAAWWYLAPQSSPSVTTRHTSTPTPAEVLPGEVQPAQPAVLAEPVAQATHVVETVIPADAPAVERPAAAQPQPAAAASPREATVVCNTQCDANDVIDDIWKFLTV